MGITTWIRVGLAGLIAISCRTPKSAEASQVEGMGLPTEEGVPITFLSNLPAQVGHEVFQNLGRIMAAANPDGRYQNIKPMDVMITCERASPAENHCRMMYDGPEMKLTLAEMLFRSMSGNVYVRRGCKGQGCDKAPLKIWWRTVAKKLPSGENGIDFEVCDIRGLEAGVSVNTPFALGSALLDKINYKPDIKGFQASIVENITQVAGTDDPGRRDGSPEREASVTFRALGLKAGLGPIGAFPNANCLLKDDHEAAYFQKQKTPKKTQDLPLSNEVLSQIPTQYIQFAADVTEHMAQESAGQTLHLNLRCQDIPQKPVCEMRYRGPTLTIPIPRYITGVLDSEVQILRKCQNLGCKQQTESIIRMATYQTDDLETIEMCSTSGLEITTWKKMPSQSRIIGAPDIKGMIMRIAPGTVPPGRDPQDPRVQTLATLKSFHIGFAGLGAYPSTRCLFVED